MKFRFCGDQDCPDWLLAEMATLSRLSSIKFKLLAQEVSKHLRDETLDFEKAGKLTSDAKFSEKDLQAAIAAIKFILNSASRYATATDEDVVNNELQQLGLPKEHATAVSKVWAEAADVIRERQKSKSLAINRVEQIGSTMQGNQISLVLHTRDSPSGQQRCYSVDLPFQQTQLLLHELRQAAKLVEQFVPKDI
nr:EOG090X0HLW [Lepidurus arcticus]